jgi:hypothetical protein
MYVIKGLHFLFLSTCVSIAAMVNIEVDDFVSPTIEHFNDSWVTASYYDFDNGMNYSNLSGTRDYINFDGRYSLANAGIVNFGRDHDNFFCTNFAPTSFAFTFSETIYQF